MAGKLPCGPKIEWKYPISLDLSVVIPLHRSRPGTERAVRSVLSQASEGMELLVVDHRPEAGRIDVWQDFLGRTRSIQTTIPLVYLAEKPAGSMAGDWNLAISNARGRLIHLLHDDDHVLQGFYSAVRERCVGVCHTGYCNRNADGSTNFSRLGEDRDPRNGNFLQPVAVVASRRAYEEVGGYLTDPAFRHCPDWEFCCRCWSAGMPVSFIEDVLAVHNEGGDSETKDAGGAYSLEVLESVLAALTHMASYVPHEVKHAAFHYYMHAQELMMGDYHAPAFKPDERERVVHLCRTFIKLGDPK